MQIDKAIVLSLAIILPFLILLGSATNTVVDRQFYENQKFPYPSEVVDYFSGKSDTLQISKLNADELSHMQDVKSLIKSLKITYWILLSIYTVLILLLFVFSDNVLKGISKFLYIGGIASNIFFIVLILLILFSFTQSFWIFHQIFFPQGNWAFPENSYLIQIFPESFFVAGFKQIMVSSFVIGLVMLLAGLMVRLFQRKIYNTQE